MKITALLPMKGNSERVPNKNLKLFNGKPLYHWIMQSLLASKYIDQIVVNTDSQAIKSDIEQHFSNRDVLIENRPEPLVGDYVSMNKIIGHDISRYPADLYLQKHSTNPLLRATTIDAALEKMIGFVQTQQYDSIFSVTKIQTRLYNAQGAAFNHNPQELIRTQDLDPLFEENSNFFIFSKSSFEKAGEKRIGIEPWMFEMNKIEAMDIDEKEDFLIAEAIHKLALK